jgi:fatty-acyl-CoA synthase
MTNGAKRPCAFVELRPGYDLSEEDVIEHCRSLLARFKCPRTVIFHEVPKTSTGKIQKYLLRDEAKTLGSS